MDFEPERYLDTQAQPGLSMPFNLDAEQSVLGAVLLDAGCRWGRRCCQGRNISTR